MANFTTIPTGSPANASTFNNPMTELSNAIDEVREDQAALIGIVSGITSSAVNGLIASYTTEIVVDDASVFVEDAFIAYQLSNGNIEYNEIASVNLAENKLLLKNLTGGGIDDNEIVSMVTIDQMLARGNYNNIAARLDGSDAFPGAARVSGVVSATDTSVTFRQASGLKVGMWVALSPFTTNCEIRRIDGFTTRTATVAALQNSHAADSAVMLFDQQPEFNVKWYGAAGDDATDDSAVISKAISDLPSTGGVILFPPGTYRCNLNITGVDGLTLRGKGRDSELKTYDATDYLLDVRTSDNFTIEYLSLDGRYGDGATIATTLLEALNNCEIHHCYFDNALFRAINFDITVVSGAVQPPKNQFISIHHNEFGANIERDAIYAGNIGHAWIHHNLIRSSPDYAIDTGGRISNVTISDNVILDCNGGIYGDAVEENFVVKNNIVLGVAGNGINCNGYDSNTRGCIIEGNILLGDSGQTAILCAIQGARIQDNDIQGFGNQVLRVQAADIVVAGNKFDTPDANYSIEITSSGDRAIIEGNQFLLGSSKAGITCAADDIVVAGNFFAEPDGAVVFTGTTSGHRLENNILRDSLSGFSLANVTASVVKNNTFIDSQFNTDIVESGTADNNLIIDNIVRNRFAIAITGAGTTSRRNTNAPSSASGVATITSGNTSVTVTFSGQLVLAPSIQHIHVTPNTTWGSSTKWWVSNVTSTTFQINVDVAPGASFTFGWMINIVP